MAQPDILAFNVGAFVSTLFLLELGADKFVTSTAIIASRIGISEVVIGLLTAGAEWEEVSTRQMLIVVIANQLACCRCRIISTGSIIHCHWQCHRRCYF